MYPNLSYYSTPLFLARIAQSPLIMAQSARWSQTNQTLADRISARTPDREKTSRSSGGIKLDRCKASKSESDPSGTVSKLQPNM